MLWGQLPFLEGAIKKKEYGIPCYRCCYKTFFYCRTFGRKLNVCKQLQFNRLKIVKNCRNVFELVKEKLFVLYFENLFYVSKKVLIILFLYFSSAL